MITVLSELSRQSTLLPFKMADSDMNFSESLKIPNKVKKISATMRIDSMWNLCL
jgi:hypothetical protein